MAPKEVTTLEQQKHSQELLRALFDHMSGDLERIGPGEGVEVCTTRGPRLVRAVHNNDFQLTVKRSFGRRVATSMQQGDVGEVVMTINRGSYQLHEWFTKRLREKLGSPMLDLAFDFDWLGDCYLMSNLKKDEAPTANITTAQRDRKFPREGFDPKKHGMDSYLHFANALNETMREFWDQHGRAIVEKTVGAKIAEPAGETAAAAKKIVE